MNENTNELDTIIQRMIETVELSRENLFAFNETYQSEYQELKVELDDVQQQMKDIIRQSKELDELARTTQQYLAEISNDFGDYSEIDVRQAYEKAYDVHGNIQLLQQAENQCIQRHRELERRMVLLSKQMERAESIATQMNVVYNYLTRDFQQIGEIVEDARQKQEFGFRIIEAQEEERKRLSREIHDGTAQTLAHILIRSDLIERISREKGIDQALLEMKVVREHVRTALYEVRRLIYDLRPMALDDLGLIPTLNKYLKTVEEYNNIPIKFIHSGWIQRVSSNFEVACFRLIQEAVQNACKHANPTMIHVNITMNQNEILLSIQDDGKGFEINQTKNESFGIIGMRERVDLLNGKLAIQTERDKGTTISVSLPYIN